MAKEPTSTSDAHAAGSAAGEEAKRKQRIRTRVAMGIGSAAIVAALLYANSGRKGDRGKS